MFVIDVAVTLSLRGPAVGMIFAIDLRTLPGAGVSLLVFSTEY